jgi:hypothetical protein
MLVSLLDKLRFIKDKSYVNKIYRQKYFRDINWDHPTRYTEKINILKISPEVKKLAKYTDKYLVRDYVKKTIGEQYLVPLIGVYSSVDDIDFASLPSQFILKCTHGSGMNLICLDKAGFDWSAAKNQLKIWLKSNFYHTFGRELQYNYIQPRIICEEYLSSEGNDIVDYKIYCFAGKPEFIRIMSGRSTSLRKNIYDCSWGKPPFQFMAEGTDSNWILPKPKNLEEMIDVATKLSAPFSFVRVDLYNSKGRVYFGELTFTPAAGIQFFSPDSYDELYGSKF